MTATSVSGNMSLMTATSSSLNCGPGAASGGATVRGTPPTATGRRHASGGDNGRGDCGGDDNVDDYGDDNGDDGGDDNGDNEVDDGDDNGDDEDDNGDNEDD